MSRKRRSVSSEEEEAEPEQIDLTRPTGAHRRLNRLRHVRHAVNPTEAAEAEGTAMAGPAAATASQPGGAGSEPTPQRRAPPRTPPASHAAAETPTAQLGGRRSRPRRLQLDGASAKRSEALARLRSGQGPGIDLTLDFDEGDTEEGSDQDEERMQQGDGEEEKGEEEDQERMQHARRGPPQQQRQQQGGRWLRRPRGSHSMQSAGEEEEEDDELEEDELADFVVEDGEMGDAALAEMRGMMAGAALSKKGQHRLYCQLRLLRLLEALPAAGAATGVSEEERSCIERALELEHNLKQLREQGNNLVGWRRADAGLRERFEEYPVASSEDGGYQWGRHCASCRRDIGKHIFMHRVSFLGQPTTVEWLEPELLQRGLLPCQPGIMHGLHPQAGGSSDEEDDEKESEGEEAGEPSSSDDSLLGRDNRQRKGSRPWRQPPRKRRRRAAAASDEEEEAEQPAARAAARRSGRGGRSTGRAKGRSAGRITGGSGGTRRGGSGSADPDWEPEEGQDDGDEGDDDGAVVVDDDEDDDVVVVEDDSGDDDEESGDEEEGEDDDEEEEGVEGGEEELHDPGSSDSDASECGQRPRLHPRLGMDCWARAFVYHAVHRYPARLDSMLKYLTRLYLRRTPAAELPGDLPGLAAAVVRRYGHALFAHWKRFNSSITAFNLLQNKRHDKTAGNAHIVAKLTERMYAEITPLSEMEQEQGVDWDGALATWAAVTRVRQAAQAGSSCCRGAAGSWLQLLLPGQGYESAEEDGGEEDEEVDDQACESGEERGPRRGGGGDSSDDGGGGGVGGRPRPGGARRSAGGARHDSRSLRRQQQQQQRREPAAAPQGGQRAAAAVAAAAGAFFSQHQQEQETQQQGQQQGRQTLLLATPPMAPAPQTQQQQQAPQSRTACFTCGHEGHWAAECPEKKRRQACFRCGQEGHWSADCPEKRFGGGGQKRRQGACFRCGQEGHWSADCPLRS